MHFLSIASTCSRDRCGLQLATKASTAQVIRVTCIAVHIIRGRVHVLSLHLLRCGRIVAVARWYAGSNARVRPHSVHLHPTARNADASVKFWLMAPVYDARIEAQRCATAPLYEGSAHEGGVRVVRWSCDGRQLASGGQDGVIVIWRQRAGVPPAAASLSAAGARDYPASEWWPPAFYLKGPSLSVRGKPWLPEIRDIAWHPRGAHLVSCSNDSQVLVWRIPPAAAAACGAPSAARIIGAPLLRIAEHASFVCAVAWDPFGALLATLGQDKRLLLWRATGFDEDDVEAHEREEERVARAAAAQAGSLSGGSDKWRSSSGGGARGGALARKSFSAAGVSAAGAAPAAPAKPAAAPPSVFLAGELETPFVGWSGPCPARHIGWAPDGSCLAAAGAFIVADGASEADESPAARGGDGGGDDRPAAAVAGGDDTARADVSDRRNEVCAALLSRASLLRSRGGRDSARDGHAVIADATALLAVGVQNHVTTVRFCPSMLMRMPRAAEPSDDADVAFVSGGTQSTPFGGAARVTTRRAARIEEVDIALAAAAVTPSAATHLLALGAADGSFSVWAPPPSQERQRASSRDDGAAATRVRGDEGEHHSVVRPLIAVTGAFGGSVTDVAWGHATWPPSVDEAQRMAGGAVTPAATAGTAPLLLVASADGTLAALVFAPVDDGLVCASGDAALTAVCRLYGSRAREVAAAATELVPDARDDDDDAQSSQSSGDEDESSNSRRKRRRGRRRDGSKRRSSRRHSLRDSGMERGYLRDATAAVDAVQSPGPPAALAECLVPLPRDVVRWFARGATLMWGGRRRGGLQPMTQLQPLLQVGGDAAAIVDAVPETAVFNVRRLLPSESPEDRRRKDRHGGGSERKRGREVVVDDATHLADAGVSVPAALLAAVLAAAGVVQPLSHVPTSTAAATVPPPQLLESIQVEGRVNGRRRIQPVSVAGTAVGASSGGLNDTRAQVSFLLQRESAAAAEPGQDGSLSHVGSAGEPQEGGHRLPSGTVPPLPSTHPGSASTTSAALRETAAVAATPAIESARIAVDGDGGSDDGDNRLHRAADSPPAATRPQLQGDTNSDAADIRAEMDTPTEQLQQLDEHFIVVPQAEAQEVTLPPRHSGSVAVAPVGASADNTGAAEAGQSDEPVPTATSVEPVQQVVPVAKAFSFLSNAFYLALKGATNQMDSTEPQVEAAGAAGSGTAMATTVLSDAFPASRELPPRPSTAVGLVRPPATAATTNIVPLRSSMSTALIPDTSAPIARSFGSLRASRIDDGLQQQQQLQQRRLIAAALSAIDLSTIQLLSWLPRRDLVALRAARGEAERRAARDTQRQRRGDGAALGIGANKWPPTGDVMSQLGPYLLAAMFGAAGGGAWPRLAAGFRPPSLVPPPQSHRVRYAADEPVGDDVRGAHSSPQLPYWYEHDELDHVRSSRDARGTAVAIAPFRSGGAAAFSPPAHGPRLDAASVVGPRSQYAFLHGIHDSNDDREVPVATSAVRSTHLPYILPLPPTLSRVTVQLLPLTDVSVGNPGSVHANAGSGVVLDPYDVAVAAPGEVFLTTALCNDDVIESAVGNTPLAPHQVQHHVIECVRDWQPLWRAGVAAGVTVLALAHAAELPPWRDTCAATTAAAAGGDENGSRIAVSAGRRTQRILFVGCMDGNVCALDVDTMGKLAMRSLVVGAGPVRHLVWVPSLRQPISELEGSSGNASVQQPLQSEVPKAVGRLVAVTCDGRLRVWSLRVHNAITANEMTVPCGSTATHAALPLLSPLCERDLHLRELLESAALTLGVASVAIARVSLRDADHALVIALTSAAPGSSGPRTVLTYTFDTDAAAWTRDVGG